MFLNSGWRAETRTPEDLAFSNHPAEPPFAIFERRPNHE
jgi:hypothetical protein